MAPTLRDWTFTDRQAGTFRYPGDTPLDKVFGMSDLLAEAARGLQPTEARAERMAVSKTLFALEKAILKAHPEWRPT